MALVALVAVVTVVWRELVLALLLLLRVLLELVRVLVLLELVREREFECVDALECCSWGLLRRRCRGDDDAG